MRWFPAISMMLVSVISYIDRNTLAILAPTILRETGLSAQQYGFIISAFSIAYMLSNPIWGRILDRTGLRRGMVAAAIGSVSSSVMIVMRSSGFSRRQTRMALRATGTPSTMSRSARLSERASSQQER